MALILCTHLNLDLHLDGTNRVIKRCNVNLKCTQEATTEIDIIKLKE